MDGFFWPLWSWPADRLDGARTHTEAALSVKRPSIHPSHPSIHPSILEASPSPSLQICTLSNNPQKILQIITLADVPPIELERVNRCNNSEFLQMISGLKGDFSPFLCVPTPKHQKREENNKKKKSKKSFWGVVSERQPRYGCFRLMDDARQSNTVSGRPQIESSSRTNIFHQPDNNGRRKNNNKTLNDRQTLANSPAIQCWNILLIDGIFLPAGSILR